MHEEILVSYMWSKPFAKGVTSVKNTGSVPKDACQKLPEGETKEAVAKVFKSPSIRFGCSMPNWANRRDVDRANGPGHLTS